MNVLLNGLTFQQIFAKMLSAGELARAERSLKDSTL
jgi:hypothetical protein